MAREVFYRDLDPPAEHVASVYAIELQGDGNGFLYRGRESFELPKSVIADLYRFLNAHTEVFLGEKDDNNHVSSTV